MIYFLNKMKSNLYKTDQKYNQFPIILKKLYAIKKHITHRTCDYDQYLIVVKSWT